MTFIRSIQLSKNSLSIIKLKKYRKITSLRAQKMVELSGIEPLTPWLQTRCSPS